MRIDKFLSNSGCGSRKDVKAFIKKRLVTCDGETVSRPEFKIDPDKNEICLNGEVIQYVKFVYLMMNKPSGVISASNDPYENDVTVVDLALEKFDFYGIFPVGRLDKDATGLIMLTNDGIFAHRATSPKKNLKKIYYVEVLGELTEKDAGAFKRGVKLDDGYICKEAGLEILSSGAVSTAYVTLTEGKFHQVKRMFESLNKKVSALKRVSFCGVELDPNLEEGDVRPLTESELNIIAPYVSGEKDK